MITNATNAADRVCVRITTADREALAKISEAIKVPHRDTPCLSDLVRAAISIAGATVTANTLTTTPV